LALLTAVWKQKDHLLFHSNINGGRALLARASRRSTPPAALQSYYFPSLLNPHHCSATTAKASFSTETAAPPPELIVGSSPPEWLGYRIMSGRNNDEQMPDEDEKKDLQPQPLDAGAPARDNTHLEDDDGGSLSSTQKNATIELKNFLERHVGAWRSSVEFRRIRVLYGDFDETTTKDDKIDETTTRDDDETTTKDDDDETTTNEEEQESSGENFSTRKKTKRKRKVGWSAVFTCPITNVKVSSKTLRTTTNHKEGLYHEAPIAAHDLDQNALATATYFVPQQKKRKYNQKITEQDIIDDHGTTIHSLVLYNSWQMAKHAAAGAYLDAVQQHGNMEKRFCVELPTPIRIGVPPSEEEQGVMMRRRIIIGEKTLPALPWDQMNGPLVMLNTAFRFYYDQRYRPGALVTVTTTTVTDAVWEGSSSKDNDKNSNKNNNNGDDDGGDDELEIDATTTTSAAPPVRKDILWHAIFTCPVTGTQFPSSVYRDQKNYYNNNKNVVVRYCQRDGMVYYSHKKEAINAAAARFFDALACRMGIDDKPYDTSMRLCQDDPAILGDKLGIADDERDKPHEAITERDN
jgi:hypothetical protein